MTGVRFVFCALSFAVVGCARHPASELAAPSPTGSSAELAPIFARAAGGGEAGTDEAIAEPTALVDDSSLADAAAVPSGAEWVELVRMHRWNDAWQKLELLDDQQKGAPAMRLVRARVAFEKGDAASTVRLLDALERDLPPLADDIARLRAEAELSAGPYEPAARYFAQKPGLKAAVRAALAFDKAGLAADARTAADRIIASGKGDRDEAAARVLRAFLADSGGQSSVAAADARWVVVHAPDQERTADLESMLARLDPANPLTGRERLIRAERLADTGHPNDALAELERAATAPGAPSAGEVAFTRGQILYRTRGRYTEAAAAFDKAAAAGTKPAEALFYASRARSRADNDDEAKRGYRALARRFPTSTWADEASYLLARLAFIHGEWAAAAAGYREYAKAFPRGKERDTARYESAVALLAAGQAKRARTELKALAAGAQGQELARLRELEGVAAVRSGDKQTGIEILTDVVHTQPLSFGALMAFARLSQLGVSQLPPLIEGGSGTISATPGPTEPAGTHPNEPPPLVVKLPAGVDFYHRLGLDTDAEAYLRTREAAVSAQAPGREKEALCAVYGQIERSARAYRLAQDAVRGSTLLHAPTPATRWGWDCLYPRPYAAMVDDLEQREKLPHGLIYAVMRQESGYDPDAVSPARAVGLLQLMPDTAQKIAQSANVAFDGGSLTSPAVNLDFGARYLAKLLGDLGGSVPLASAAYNAGPAAVKRWLARAHDVDLDLWVALIPYEETRGYVPRVVSNLAKYALLDGGESAVPSFDLSLPKNVTIARTDF